MTLVTRETSKHGRFSEYIEVIEAECTSNTHCKPSVQYLFRKMRESFWLSLSFIDSDRKELLLYFSDNLSES